jgi:hypothetical protein
MDLGDNPRWVFEQVDPMGGARATAWRDTLEGSNLSTEARLAREAIQNSVDATLKGLKTKVLVWDKPLSGQEVTAFRRSLALSSPDSPTNRLPKLGLAPDNFFESLRGDGAGETRVTIVEDRETCGLGVDEKDGKDRFEELCLYLGQESPRVDSSRGGSYGFGKTVYQASSNCRTFLVYSVFEPTSETKGHHARLFGCSTFDGHDVKGRKYTGRAWFGIPDTAESGRPTCNPIVDEAAHKLAQSLGFFRRDRDDLGTSVMVLGSEIDVDRLREAVEDYWWPRLASDKLEVELWRGNDEELPPPEPLTRPELAPFMRCYRLIEDGNIPTADDERRLRMNAQGGRQRGQLALKALPPDSPDVHEDPEKDTNFKNVVALIRSGPQMVVQYLDTGGRADGNFAGVFVSHPDSEEALHLSEPAAHDAWNPNSERLRKADPAGERRYKTLVEGILRTIKSRAREFQRSLGAGTPTVHVSGTRKLEQILAKIMPAKGLGTQRPKPARDPFRVRIDEKRTNTATTSTVAAQVQVWLRQDAPVEEAVARMSIRPTIVLDDNKQRSSSERLNLASVTIDGHRVDHDSPIDLVVSKNTIVSVEVESERFDRDLYADLEVSLVRTKNESTGDDSVASIGT